MKKNYKMMPLIGMTVGMALAYIPAVVVIVVASFFTYLVRSAVMAIKETNS
jgi:hypothetical protein